MGSGQSKEHMVEIGKKTRFTTTNQPENPGRKPKLVSGLIQDLKAEGYEAITPAQVSEIIGYLLNLEKDRIKQIAFDDTLPVYAQRIARRLYGASDREIGNFLEQQLSRAHGQPSRNINLSGDVSLSTYVLPNGERVEI